MKVVLNRKHGEFNVSQKGYKYLIEKKGWKFEPLPQADEDFDEINCDLFIIDGEYEFVEPNLNLPQFRSNPDLVEMVEKLGAKANGDGADLRVIDVPIDKVLHPVVLNSYGFEYVVDFKNLWSDGEELETLEMVDNE